MPLPGSRSDRIVLRMGYGLGAMAMAGGSFHAPQFAVAWPTGEIGGMGLEGALRLGFRKGLDAVADPAERRQLFDRLVRAAYRHGRALNSATTFERALTRPVMGCLQQASAQSQR